MAGRAVRELVRPEIRGLQVYREPTLAPGTLRLHANENPYLFPPEVLRSVLDRAAEADFPWYPDPEAAILKEKVVAYAGVRLGQVLVGNGSNELIQAIMLTFGKKGTRVVISTPTFSMYKVIAGIAGMGVAEVPMKPGYAWDVEGLQAAAGQDEARLVFLCSPNNPTGGCLDRAAVEGILAAARSVVVVDEAYFEFAGETVADLVGRWPNLVVLRTFSKAFGLAGLRVGYLIAHEQVVEQVGKVLLPYNLNSFSQLAAEAALEYREFFRPQLEAIIRERQWLREELAGIEGVEVFPSKANFILFRVPGCAGNVFRRLAEEGVFIRYFNEEPGLEKCLRISVGKKEDNSAFVEKIRNILG